jgi:hypothetical protein
MARVPRVVPTVVGLGAPRDGTSRSAQPTDVKGMTDRPPDGSDSGKQSGSRLSILRDSEHFHGMNVQFQSHGGELCGSHVPIVCSRLARRSCQ